MLRERCFIVKFCQVSLNNLLHRNIQLSFSTMSIQVYITFMNINSNCHARLVVVTTSTNTYNVSLLLLLLLLYTADNNWTVGTCRYNRICLAFLWLCFLWHQFNLVYMFLYHFIFNYCRRLRHTHTHTHRNIVTITHTKFLFNSIYFD